MKKGNLLAVATSLLISMVAADADTMMNYTMDLSCVRPNTVSEAGSPKELFS